VKSDSDEDEGQAAPAVQVEEYHDAQEWSKAQWLAEAKKSAKKSAKDAKSKPAKNAAQRPKAYHSFAARQQALGLSETKVLGSPPTSKKPSFGKGGGKP
jgi:hypothetical protein